MPRELFPQLAGNAKLKTQLAPTVSSTPPSLSHAYILEGPHGSGKHTLARAVAASLVCENREKDGPLPCGNCLACRKIFRDISPDFITVRREEDKSTLGIEPIRALRSDIHIYPNELEYKFYLVEDADTMTVQAQNAFLLTLEEPPAYGVMFLLCENSRALLETVRSRAQTLRLQPLTNEETARRLAEISPEAAALQRQNPALFTSAVVASRGCPGRARELLSTAEGEEITARRAAAEKFLRLVSDRTTAAEAMCMLIAECRGSREKALLLLADLSDALCDLILLKKSETSELRFFPDREAALDLSDAFSMQRLLALSDAVKTADTDLNRNLNVRLTLMSMLADAGIL